MLNEGVTPDHNPGHYTTLNSSRSLKVGPAEAVPIETPALEASKVLPAASAQGNVALEAGMFCFVFHLSSIRRMEHFGKKLFRIM